MSCTKFCVNVTGAIVYCALLLLSAEEGYALPAPIFGFDTFFNPSALSNGSTALATLAAAHAAHSLSSLQQLAEFAALAQNLSLACTYILSHHTLTVTCGSTHHHEKRILLQRNFVLTHLHDSASTPLLPDTFLYGKQE